MWGCCRKIQSVQYCTVRVTKKIQYEYQIPGWGRLGVVAKVGKSSEREPNTVQYGKITDSRMVLVRYSYKLT